jgi:hypothetical protein
MMEYDYGSMPTRQLAALMRQARRANGETTCERGHAGCGCSTVRSTMNGRAACSQAVSDELTRRRANNSDKQEAT